MGLRSLFSFVETPTRLRLAPTLTCLLMLVGCRSHSTDAELQRWFLLHSSEFEELATVSRSDSVVTVQPHRLTIEVRPGRLQTFNVRSDSDLPLVVSSERWRRYQDLLAVLRVHTVYRDKRDVMFQIDEPGFLNGDSQKGILYSRMERSSRSSLDGLTATELKSSSCEATKKIRENWYLYLDYSCD